MQQMACNKIIPEGVCRALQHYSYSCYTFAGIIPSCLGLILNSIDSSPQSIQYNLYKWGAWTGKNGLPLFPG